jgi:hypothetical protein
MLALAYLSQILAKIKEVHVKEAGLEKRITYFLLIFGLNFIVD